MSNKIVTSVSALTDDTIDNISDNNIVCIDIEQGRIGVHKSNPTSEIDVNGTISCTTLKINGFPINPEGTVDFQNMETNLIPIETNTYTIGSANKLWSTAYINKTNISEANITDASINTLTVLSSTNRLYQEINIQTSWNAVNGYYGLAKNAYPALDPLSYGAKAISNWTSIVVGIGDWTGICWSPELRIFVAVATSVTDTNKVMTSYDGIRWTPGTSLEDNDWVGVCWSPQLRKFVAVGSGEDGIMFSTDGINWESTEEEDSYNLNSICWSPELELFVAVGLNNIKTSSYGLEWNSQEVNANEWKNVCWSPELGIFVAVAISEFNNGVITSPDGITWTSRTTQGTGCDSVCWSSELGIFVAVASRANNDTTIMTSRNGIDWNTVLSNYGTGWTSVCWCPQLRIFVAVGPDDLLTSANGISWVRFVPSDLAYNLRNICWSPELGIFVGVSIQKVMISSLKGRPPTSYNVFDSSFNSIDQSGVWTFQKVVISDTITIPNDSITEAKLAQVLRTKLDAKANRDGPTTFTGTIILPYTTTIGNVNSTELGYIDGVTSSIQTQLTDLSNNKAPKSSPTFTGKVTLPANTINSNDISNNAIITSKIADLAVTEAKLATAVQTKLNAVGGVFEIKNSNFSLCAITINMRYYSNTSNEYVYQFQNVSIPIGDVMYISYTLPNNFATLEFQLLVTGDTANRLNSSSPYSFSEVYPLNGIINDRVDTNRTRVLFNIQKNAHHYLDIVLLVNST